MSYTIRAAALTDVAAIVRHREQMFRSMGTACDYPAMARAFGRWLETAVPDGTYRGWVAEPAGGGGVVAGGGLVVMAWPPGPGRLDPRMAYVYNVFTEPEHRGHGLARRLMETMHQWCRAQGIERVALNASALGRPVYESMGYEMVEPMMRLVL